MRMFVAMKTRAGMLVLVLMLDFFGVIVKVTMLIFKLIINFLKKEFYSKHYQGCESDVF